MKIQKKKTKKELVDSAIWKWASRLGLGRYYVKWTMLTSNNKKMGNADGFFNGIDYMDREINIAVRTTETTRIEEIVLHELLHAFCAILRHDYESIFDAFLNTYSPDPDHSQHFIQPPINDGAYILMVALAQQIKQTSFVQEEMLVQQLTDTLLDQDNTIKYLRQQIEILKHDNGELERKMAQISFDKNIKAEVIEGKK